MIEIDPTEWSGKEAYFFMISAIVPRPVAWVTTQDRAGKTNLAPFSYFQGVCSRPMLFSICIGHRKVNGELVKKDTLRNIEATGEFVVHLASDDLAAEVTASSAEYPPGDSEIESLGLETMALVKVAPPRLRCSTLHLEAQLERVIMLGEPALTGMVIGRVVQVHASPEVYDVETGTVDVTRLRPLARLGGELYGKVREPFEVRRPDWESWTGKAD